jgi:hypothetical protein
MIIPVVITIYTDRSFSFATKTPPTSRMLLKAAGAPRGAKNPLTERAGAVTKAQIKEIAEKKMVDLNAFDLDAMLMIGELPVRWASRWRIDRHGAYRRKSAAAAVKVDRNRSYLPIRRWPP